MKPKYLIILFLSIITLSCSEDDTNNNEPQNEPIIGSWQLNTRNLGWGGLTNYNPGDVTFKFNTDGTLDVISIISGFESETYNYELIFDCLFDPGCPNDETPEDVLLIGSTRYRFSITNENEMFLESLHDSPEYFLERLP